jgi:hypothetical protein
MALRNKAGRDKIPHPTNPYPTAIFYTGRGPFAEEETRLIFVTFYFSGTGNTKWAVGELHRSILSTGSQSRCVSIEEKFDLKELTEKADFIGVAFPVYAMNPPRIVRQFLKRLGDALAENNLQKPFMC